MRFLNYFAVAIMAMLYLFAPRPCLAESKLLLVHYMPWFQSPFSLGNHNWGYHWTMNHSNPNTIDSVSGQRQIASWYYPLIGPYDTSDPAVLEYHVLLMKLAGIDGVIVDWYGPDNYYDYAVNNVRTLDLLNEAAKAGLRFSLCYEDATIQAEINGGCMNNVCVNSTNAVQHAQYEMLYAQSNYFAHPNFLRWNSKPVLLNFGPQYFYSSSQWTSIFSVLEPSNVPALFTENSRLPNPGSGAFDWPPMQLSKTTLQSPTEPVLSDAALNSYLASFDVNGGQWPAYISTAFPRFHDYYSQAGVGASYGYLDDENGNTLRKTLARAMTNSSAFIQIATWNDYGEGTIIEPTAEGTEPTTEYGFADLGIVQDLRRQYMDANFPYHTNDLTLAVRLYNQREQHLNNPAVSAELDRIFNNIVAGKIASAERELAGIETTHPVIYNLVTNSNELQFFVGGYLAAGAQIEVSTNLTTWQTAQSFAAGTNLLVFTTDTSHPVCRFFKVQ